MLILSVTVKSAEAISAMGPEELSAYQLAEAAAVQNPYVILAFVLFALLEHDGCACAGSFVE